MLSTLEQGLARAEARLADLVDRVRAGETRLDVAGIPEGALALVLARLEETTSRRFLVVTPELDEARRLGESLTLFASSSSGSERERADVLVYPVTDASPFVELAPDRQATMARLGVLFRLARKLPWRFVVAPVAALLRKVVPEAALAGRSLHVEVASELDREHAIALLAESGYMRVPVVEDPGTFAVRGALFDVYPPSARLPARIELDGDLVASIKLFDPDDQRTIRSVDELFVHPARESLLGEHERKTARTRLLALADRLELPSTQSRRLVDEVESGRLVLGADGYLPAFYDALESLFAYLPDDVGVVVVDPERVAHAARDELGRAIADRSARLAKKEPAFDLDDLYLDEDALAKELDPRSGRKPLVVAHRLAVAGDQDEHEGPLDALVRLPRVTGREGAADESRARSHDFPAPNKGGGNAPNGAR